MPKRDFPDARFSEFREMEDLPGMRTCTTSGNGFWERESFPFSPQASDWSVWGTFPRDWSMHFTLLKKGHIVPNHFDLLRNIGESFLAHFRLAENLVNG